MSNPEVYFHANEEMEDDIPSDVEEGGNDTPESVLDSPKELTTEELSNALKKANNRVKTLEEEKARRKARSKKIGAIAGLALAGAGVGAAVTAGAMNNANKTSEVPQSAGEEPRVEGTIENDLNNLPDEMPEELKEDVEVEMGIQDGYDKPGMYDSASKAHEVDFASAKEAAEVCGNNRSEIIKYEAENQVESLATFSAAIPQEVKDYYGKQTGYEKGMSILDTEDMLEKVPDSKYDKYLADFKDLMDQAEWEDVTLDGDYHNAYMKKNNPDAASSHENIELVQCVTNEPGTKASRATWKNAEGEVIGSVTYKISTNENGEVDGGCTQIVVEMGGHTEIFNGMSEISDPSNPNSPEKPDQPDNPDEPEKPDEPEVPPVVPPVTPEPTPDAPKNAENMTRIDTQIQQDIAQNIGTGEVHVNQTPTQVVESQVPTTPPPAESYQGTSANTVQNTASQSAEQVQQQVSPANTYSENQGGANANQPAPVQANQAAQQAADTAEIPVQQAPTSGDALADVLGDLGIN